MKYTLSQAAAATGKNKATVQRAIKSGKMSASKNSSGAYEIDPSELHRVFPPTGKSVAQHQNTTLSNRPQHTEKSSEHSKLQRISELEKQLAVAEERKQGVEGQLSHLSETVDDLRKRLDQSELRITALLSDHRSKSFWKRLFG